MEILIDGIKVHYIVEGKENKNEILLLHGWGASIEAFLPVYKYLSINNKVYVLDFPGFGKSEEPKSVYSVKDYANLVLEFITRLNIKSPTLIGHSFGGRVIMKLVGELSYTPKNIILIDSAGIRPKRKPSYYFKVYSYKLAKNIVKLVYRKKSEEIINKMRKKSGSTDYRNASDMMRKIMVGVVNEDLVYTLENIKVPTLVIWGEKDEETPLKDAKVIESKIPDCGIVVLKGAGHFSYLDNLQEFLVIVDNFLKVGEKK